MPLQPNGPDVDELLASVPIEDREILSLRFVAGLTLQEIADSYELTLSAAKMRLYRAIDQLRATLVDTHPNFFEDMHR
jgi:RNA polymerase sigma-70 factor (ECF subfamily)